MLRSGHLARGESSINNATVVKDSRRKHAKEAAIAVKQSQMPSRDEGPRINREITARNVRLVGADGEMVGVVSLHEALNAAADAGLDLVEVAATAEPPVCKIIDYGKFKYEAQKKAAEARKNQRVIEVKEVQLRPNIDDHDLDVKLKAVDRFLGDGDRVKFVMRFRGRELAHQDIGMKILNRTLARLGDRIKIEHQPKFEGRAIHMIVAPRA